TGPARQRCARDYRPPHAAKRTPAATLHPHHADEVRRRSRGARACRGDRNRGQRCIAATTTSPAIPSSASTITWPSGTTGSGFGKQGALAESQETEREDSMLSAGLDTATIAAMTLGSVVAYLVTNWLVARFDRSQSVVDREWSDNLIPF